MRPSWYHTRTKQKGGPSIPAVKVLVEAFDLRRPLSVSRMYEARLAWFGPEAWMQYTIKKQRTDFEAIA